MVAGRIVVAVVVRKVVVAGPTGLAAEDRAVAVAGHMRVVWAVVHTVPVALDMVTEDAATVDMEKTSGRAVVEAVCCILIVLEDMATMSRKHFDPRAEDMATEVARKNRVAEA